MADTWPEPYGRLRNGKAGDAEDENARPALV